MSTTVVILQPQYFPWLGVFEQISACDIYVHLDNVQLPLGRSLITRVQVKGSRGMQWLSMPTVRKSGQRIIDARTDDTLDWREKHLSVLRASFARYHSKEDAISIVEEVFREAGSSVCDINIAAVERISKYLGLKPHFMRASQMSSTGSKGSLIQNILAECGATRYITGMGGLQYLDHESLEKIGISVSYPAYTTSRYQQDHGDFTSFVSSLDAIASCGASTRALLTSEMRDWRAVVGT